MEKLQNLTAVITGGSRGIGRALAEHLYGEGASVIICGRDAQALTETCQSLDDTESRCMGIEVDVSKIGDCEKLIQYAIDTFGKIDLLINNAGVYGDINEFQNADLKNWVHAIEINLLGTVYCTKFALEHMITQGHGKIINLAGAGIGGTRAHPRRSSYYTSKAAVVGFTETIAEEVEKYNIQVNAVAPGAINTGFIEYLIAQGPEKAGAETYAQALKQKEEGGDSLEKVLQLVTFLASAESDHVSGRLLSAKWDIKEKILALSREGDLYKLRRIDNDLFYGA